MLIARPEKCSGCRTCLVACAMRNFHEVNPKKAALSVQGAFPSPGGYGIRLCDQCGHCAEVCPVEAIAAVNGVYLIDAEACIGCGTCVEECPNRVMFLHPDSEVPIKCTACGECVEICPREALAWASESGKEEAS